LSYIFIILWSAYELDYGQTIQFIAMT